MAGSEERYGFTRQHEERLMDALEYSTILDETEGCPSNLIEVLQDIQTQCNYLPESALRTVSQKLRVPLIEVFRVATFYKAFTLVPRGKHLIIACTGTACHVRGAPRLLDELSSQLNISPGETTPDGAFTLEAVNCLGACALGPIVVLDGTYYEHMTLARVRKLIETTRAEDEEDSADARHSDT
jgi:NADH-quinone oxidoreductase subunit E